MTSFLSLWNIQNQEVQIIDELEEQLLYLEH